MAGTGNTSIRSYNFFFSGVIVVGGFAANEHIFIDADDGTPFTSKTVQILNDAGTALSFRFSPDPGTGTPHGILVGNEPLTQDFRRERRIYITGTTGAAYRIFAY